jgi:hypothetical protein
MPVCYLTRRWCDDVTTLKLSPAKISLWTLICLVAAWAISEFYDLDHHPGSWLGRRLHWAVIYFFHPGEYDFTYRVELERTGEPITLSQRIGCRSKISNNPGAAPIAEWYEDRRSISDRRIRLIAVVPRLCGINVGRHEHGEPLDLPMNFIPLVATPGDKESNELILYLSHQRLREGASGLKLIRVQATEQELLGKTDEADTFAIWGTPLHLVRDSRGHPTVLTIFPEQNPWRYNGLVGFVLEKSRWQEDSELAAYLSRQTSPTALPPKIAQKLGKTFFAKNRAMFVGLNTEYGAAYGPWQTPDIYADAIPFAFHEDSFRPIGNELGVAHLYHNERIFISALKPSPIRFHLSGLTFDVNVKDGSALFDPATQRIYYLSLIVANWNDIDHPHDVMQE